MYMEMRDETTALYYVGEEMQIKITYLDMTDVPGE